jgi:chaperonin GroES
MNYTPMNTGQADYQQPEEAGTQDTDNTKEQIDIVSLAKNLAENASDDKLNKLGYLCQQEFENDHQSRQQWEENIKDWEKLAMQIQEEKSWPWPGAANVKYPLISTASMQFAARAYPSLIPSNGDIVQARVIGQDPTGQKEQKAQRVSTYISYQCMRELPYWEEEMDKMLIMLPVVGCLFKKTYYCKEDDRIDSKLILPRQFVVDYWAKSLCEAERKSEVIQMTPRVLKEYQLQGRYRDVDLGTPPIIDQSKVETNFVTDEKSTPWEIIEMHRWYDWDDDGYEEPVIVTFERSTGCVLRVSLRYYQDDVQRNEKGKVIKIKPIEMYTKFPFVPSPDGSFYDVGFGNLLGPLNESVNTLINQILDSGTLHNLNAGFIGKSLRLRLGDTDFTPGEWKQVNATGDDLRKQIIPLPAREPSSVLLELLKFLIQAGKELASVAEIFTGKMPGQNTPATTTMATVEQGMKVFTAIYKRLYRSLAEEFDKFFYLNSIYLDPNKYVNVLDTTVGPDDFDTADCDIFPSADPTAASQDQKLQKVQGLFQLMQMMPGLLDPMQVAVRWMEATEQPNYQKLFSQQVQQTGQLPPPPPDPKVMALQAKAQIDQQKAQGDMQMQQQQMELEARDKQQQMQMAAQEHAQKMGQAADDAQLKAASHWQQSQFKIAAAQATANQKMAQSAQLHQQKMTQAQRSESLAKSQSKKP